MEAEQVLSVDGFVRLLGVAVGCNEILGQFDAHVLWVGAKAAEFLHIELCSDHILFINLELQPLLTELKKVSNSPKLSGIKFPP